MFQGPIKRRRRFDARSNRRTKKQRQLFCSRRFALELLEPRQMLCATHLGLGGPTAFPLGGDEVDRDPLPPGLAVAQSHADPHSRHGRPFEIVGDPVPADLVANGSTSTASNALHPLTSIPLLHSNPSATAKLYLDFDGHFEPVWGGHTNVTTPVYDSDGDPTMFSDSELAIMYIAWSRVAEDYAPFNVDVTLEEPPELAEGVPESVANRVAMRVAIGGDSSWTGGSYGGLAHYDVFTNTIANVVYMFSNNSGDGHYIGDVSSHEAGHGFGLLHQSAYDQNGVKIAEYAPGVGNWAPIMGGLYAPINTWHNGTSAAGPTSYQDDMAVLTRTANGFGYRADDHGDTISIASPMSFDGLVHSGSGIIGTNSDVDTWSFTLSTADTYKVRVDPAAIGPNLDAVLELRDADGTLIAATSSAVSLAAELALPLSPASYFLSVTKTAAYGWLGAYTVGVSAPPAGITVTAPQPIVTREGGAPESFTVVLDTQPAADVTIPLSSSNIGEGAVPTDSLVFTSANWNVPQIVSVTGVYDGVEDPDIPYSIVFGPVISTDAEYSGIDAADVAAVNLDNSSAGWLYWIDNGNDVIKRSKLDGSGAHTIVDFKALFGGADYVPRYLAVDHLAGKMYWTDSGTGSIQRANLNGSNVETIVSGFTGGGLRGIAIDAATGKIYWVDFASQKIQRANLDGSGVQDLVTGELTGVREIALDVAAGKMYWGDYGESNIRRANLDGTNIEVLWQGLDADNPSAIALDTGAGKMYWADAGHDKILRSNLDGSDVEELIDMRSLYPDSTVGSLEIDAAAGKIYFSDFINKVVHRANLDGSDVVAIVSDGIGVAQGIALVHPAVTVTPSTGLFTSESGGFATFQVTLTTPPQANVTIPLSSGSLQEGTVSPASVTFTSGNWNVPQTITVTGVDDSVLDGNKPYTVILGAAGSTDSEYAGVDPADVSLTNVDDEVKFYVVNDATTNVSYKYAADGTPRGNSTLSAGNSAPRGVASTILGDKSWVIDANRKVYVYSNSNGALLGSWTAGSLANNATPEGIATNGTDVWIVDSRSDKVFRYTGAAGRLTGSQTAASSFSLTSGNGNSKDIVTDGQSLWVVDDAKNTDKVFKYALSGTLQGSWTIDSANKAPTGITIDPANVSHIWIVDSGTDRVYQYNAAATRTSGSLSAALTFELAAGNTNPQGIADPPAPATPSGFRTPRPDPVRDRERRFEVASDSRTENRQLEATSSYKLLPGKRDDFSSAREKVFESLALEQYFAPAKRAQWTTDFSNEHDDWKLTGHRADEDAVSELVLESALAGVL